MRLEIFLLKNLKGKAVDKYMNYVVVGHFNCK